jgi:hypothetical protein
MRNTHRIQKNWNLFNHSLVSFGSTCCITQRTIFYFEKARLTTTLVVILSFKVKLPLTMSSWRTQKTKKKRRCIVHDIRCIMENVDFVIKCKNNDKAKHSNYRISWKSTKQFAKHLYYSFFKKVYKQRYSKFTSRNPSKIFTPFLVLFSVVAQKFSRETVEKVKIWKFSRWDLTIHSHI